MALNDRNIVVCMPAYNEAKTIGDVITKARKYANEVIVYDDGSTDNTYEAARAAGANSIIRGFDNKGYGVAIRALFEAAREKNADIMVTLDSDGQHDPVQIPSIVEPIIKENYDIVIGSRFIAKEDSMKVPKYRTIGIKTITKITEFASSYNGITDAQSGFRAYNSKALSKINLFEEGMSVSTEILLRAREKDLLLKEVPVTVSYHIRNIKTSTHNPFTHGVAVLYKVVQYISLRHPLAFYGLPGLALLIIAAVFTSNALDLFANRRYVSTNMILIAIGSSVVGVVLLATGAILYTMIALLKGRIRQDS